MTEIEKRVEIRADMQIEDDLFKRLCKKLNNSKNWENDRKVKKFPKNDGLGESFRKLFISKTVCRSYVIDKTKSHRVEYQKVKLIGDFEEIKFSENSEKYVVKKPKDYITSKIMKASKKDLDWISINNQCFQTKWKNHVTIKKENIINDTFEFSVTFSQEFLAGGKIKSTKWKDASRLIAEKVLEHYFPSIYLLLKNNLGNMAKASEKEENEKYQKKIKEVHDRIKDFKEGELYGDMSKRMKDRDERIKHLEEIEKIETIEEDEVENKDEIEKTLKEMGNSNFKTNSSTIEKPETVIEEKPERKKIQVFENQEDIMKRHEYWSKNPPTKSEKGELKYIPREAVVIETGVHEFIDLFTGKFPPHLKTMEKDRVQKEIESILRRSKLGFKITNKSCKDPKEYRFLLAKKDGSVAALSSYSDDRDTARERLYTSILNLFE